MLTLRVSQLLQDEPGARRTFELRDDSPKLGDLRLAAPLDVRGELLKTRRGILLTMDYSTTLVLPCGRCLEDFQHDVEGQYQDELLLPAGELTRRTVEIDEDAPRIMADHTIALGDIVRQELLLAAPLQPLCQSDCPGLCPNCGADLRAGSCTCTAPLAEGPFAALAQLVQSPDSDQTSHTTQKGM